MLNVKEWLNAKKNRQFDSYGVISFLVRVKRLSDGKIFYYGDVVKIIGIEYQDFEIYKFEQVVVKPSHESYRDANYQKVPINRLIPC